MSAYDANWLRGMKAKIGLIADLPEDLSLVEQLLDAMHKGKADFTLTFRRLAATVDGGADSAVPAFSSNLGSSSSGFLAGVNASAMRAGHPADIAREMQRINPAFIVRNHRIDGPSTRRWRKGIFPKPSSFMRCSRGPLMTSLHSRAIWNRLAPVIGSVRLYVARDF